MTQQRQHISMWSVIGNTTSAYYSKSSAHVSVPHFFSLVNQKELNIFQHWQISSVVWYRFSFLLNDFSD